METINVDELLGAINSADLKVYCKIDVSFDGPPKPPVKGEPLWQKIPANGEPVNALREFEGFVKRISPASRKSYEAVVDISGNPPRVFLRLVPKQKVGECTG